MFRNIIICDYFDSIMESVKGERKMNTLITIFTESGLILDIAFIIGVVALISLLLKDGTDE